MKKIFLLCSTLLFSLILFPVYGAEKNNTKTFDLDANSVIHGSAISEDNEWEIFSVVQIGGPRDCEESIWLIERNKWWSQIVKMLTFKQSGWSFPSVCTNYQNGSFLVYHANWTPGRKDGGLYEYTKKNGRYSAKRFNRLEMEYCEIGQLVSNKYGCYLVSLFGDYNPAGDTRECKIRKITSVNNELSIEDIPMLKDILVSHICWREQDAGFKDSPHLFRDVVFTTEDSLIFMDANLTDWWYYNCVNENVKQFSSKEDAFAYSNKMLAKKIKKSVILESHLYEIIGLISFLFLIVLVILLFNLRYKKQTASKSITVNDLDTKEKNKFIFNIQESERSKISRDIHDSIIQDIRVIRLQTENLEVLESSKQNQHKIEDLATDCIVKLRNICYNLTPAELISHTDGASSQIELVSIITSLANQFSSRTHVPCSIGVAPDFEYPVLEKEVTQNLFRVVQEALTNVEKHSYATKVNIYLNRKDQNLIIYITDDGVGCNPEKLKEKMMSKEHLGLRSMKDRMDLIGGQIEFNSNQDDGMEVRLQLSVYQKD